MKKIVYIIIAFLIIGIIGFSAIHKISKKNNNENQDKIEEIVPEEEISDEQERKTLVTLYFPSKENDNLETELRNIDVIKLAENPYEEIINMLVEGPKNENLKNIIPEGTKLNNAKIEGDTVIIDFSNEFIENCKDGEEKQIVDSLENTLNELNEVNYIKILIDGEENREFKNGNIKFNKKIGKGE